MTNNICCIIVQRKLDSKKCQGTGRNLFVKSRVRYIEHLHLTKFRENCQNVRYFEVLLVFSVPPFKIDKKKIDRKKIDLYGDAMLVPTWMGTNMADGNQQKHLLPSFGTKA